MVAHANEHFGGIKTDGFLRKYDNLCLSLVSFVRNFSHGFAVNGFFILSSFLLTYRLLNDFSRSMPFSIKHLTLTTLKFLIRRFFRVYMPFFVLSTAVTMSPKYLGGGWPYKPWWEMITLKNVGFNQLWTIPPEIKYYFLIPIMCMPSALPKFNKSCLIMIAILISINLINMRINLFDVKYDPNNNAFLWSNNDENFKFCLQYFLNGSLMAFGLFYLENYLSDSILVILNFKGILINIISLWLFIVALYFDDRECAVNWCFNKNTWFKPHYPIANLIWSLQIFVLLISSEKSYLKNLLEQSYCLQEAGKLSYGE